MPYFNTKIALALAAVALAAACSAERFDPGAAPLPSNDPVPPSDPNPPTPPNPPNDAGTSKPPDPPDDAGPSDPPNPPDPPNDAGTPDPPDPPDPSVPTTIAEPGKVRLFIGQDLTSIAGYAENVAEPLGVVSYTSLDRLEGLDEDADDGGGPMHLRLLASRHPRAPIALGLYLTGALGRVNSGALDQNIDRLADHLSRYAVPVLLRVGYEFDAPWNAFDPVAYRAAFTRIRDRLRGRGATRVEMVWQAAASCGGTFQNEPIEAFYPGDEAVDWIGASYFAQASCGYSPLLRLVDFARTHRKPFVIAESTPQYYDLSAETFSRDGASRRAVSAESIYDEWFRPYFAFIEQHLDVVRAVSYINADWDTQWLWDAPYENGYFGDSRVESNPLILSRWHTAIAAPHFSK
jgi:hypothetical protein